MKAILAKVKPYKTVVIGNNPNAIKFGAGINFINSGDKINYEVKAINIIKKNIQVVRKVEDMAYKVY